MMVYCIKAGYANTYVIEEPEGTVAVDVGTRYAAEKVFQLVSSKNGSQQGGLRLITATHFHIDHIGGINRLHELCPEASIHFHLFVGAYLSGKETLSVPPLRRWIFGLVPTLFKLGNPLANAYRAAVSEKKGIPLPLTGSRNRVAYNGLCDLKDSVTLSPGSGWVVLETPGHTPDSISFYCEEEKALICGDTILNMEGRGELNRFCASWDSIHRSFEKLCSFEVETMYPGHGTPIEEVKGLLSGVRSTPLNIAP